MQWFNILSLRLYCYIYWKFNRFYEHQQETKVPFLDRLSRSDKVNFCDIDFELKKVLLPPP